MKYIAPFILLGICAVSLLADLVLLNRMLRALTKREASKVEKLCNKSLVSIICGALSLSAYVVLDELEKYPYLTIGLIFLKIFGTIAPFAIGGGFEIYMFRKAAKNIK